MAKKQTQLAKGLIVYLVEKALSAIISRRRNKKKKSAVNQTTEEGVECFGDEDSSTEDIPF